MICLTETEDFKIESPTVVTIGKFDGRHIGHQKLLGRMRELKQERGYAAAVFTFVIPPESKVKGGPMRLLTTNEERRRNLERMGIDYLVEYPFTDEVAHMPAETFVEQVLVGRMNARAVVVGTDCGFGYRRSGDVRLLARLAARYGYELYVIEKEQDDSRDVSSTYVREELGKGNIEKANELLGEPYSIHGTVVHGNHIGGALLGFPTANILPPAEKHLPPFGVYVSRVRIDGRIYGGVSNIGRKPTIDGDHPAGVETFIFDMDQDIYGREIEVHLLHFIRPEQRFENIDALKEQIEKDKRFSQEYLWQMRESNF